MDLIKYIGEFLIIAIVALPPFLYLYKYTLDNIDNLFVKIAIYAVYWAGTLLLSNVMPALAVLFILRDSQRRADRGIEEGSMRFFAGDKWRFSWPSFAKAAICGIFIKYAVTVVNYLFILVLQKYGVALKNQEVINEFLKSSVVSSILYFIMIVFCAPIVEEFVFRYWLYDSVLKRWTGRIISAVITSILFMAAHYNLQGSIAFFLIGMINCYLYEKYGYWAAVANHFMFNFTSAAMLVAVKIFGIPLS